MYQFSVGETVTVNGQHGAITRIDEYGDDVKGYFIVLYNTGKEVFHYAPEIKLKQPDFIL